MKSNYTVLAVLWWCTCRYLVAAQVNVTVDDTDPSIVYQPPASWSANSISCTSCLNQGTRGNTYHQGTHVLPTLDDNGGTADGRHGKGGGDHNQRTEHQRAHPRYLLYPRARPGDPSSVDQPVTVQYNFSGTALYVYSIHPSTPSSVNLTFTLDNLPHSTFTYTPSTTVSSPTPMNVFFATSLAPAAHTLLIELSPNSVFLFDYLIYTRSDSMKGTPTSGGNEPPQTALVQGSPSETVDTGQKRRNVATFGAAVGGSVGVLSLISLGITISIIRRRRASAKRERLNASPSASHTSVAPPYTPRPGFWTRFRRTPRVPRQDSLHTNASEDSPPMSGPEPFVPRFFPGTIIPADPPPYVDIAVNSPLPSSPSFASPPSSSLITPLLVSPSLMSGGIGNNNPSHLGRSRNFSYADTPPITPPPPPTPLLSSADDVALGLPPPPPFRLVAGGQRDSLMEGEMVPVPPGIGDAADAQPIPPHSASPDLTLQQPQLRRRDTEG